MRTCKMFLAALAFVLLSGPLSAQANLVFDWTGDCQRILFGSNSLCTHATLHVVTTDDYVPGTFLIVSGDASFDPDAFPGRLPYRVVLTATYSDGIIAPFDFASFFDVWMQVPADPLSGSGSFINDAAQSQFFNSDASGAWRFEGEEHAPNCDRLHNPFCGYGVVGDNGVWTTPEPATLVLLALGLLGVVFASRAERLVK